MRLSIFNKIIIASALLSGYSSVAQDIHFSQFYETSILRNPSLTGLITGDYKLSAVYRNQWSSISKPFQTAVFNAETRIPINDVNDCISIGILGYYDKAGSVSLKTISIYPAINYNKSLEDGHNSYLSVGFTGGYIQRSYDPTKATFDNQYIGGAYSPDNPSGENLTNNKFNYWDLGAGVTFSTTQGAPDNGLNYIIGVSGYHFTQPSNSFYNNKDIRLGMKWNVNAALSKQVNEKFSFQFHANYSRQGTYSEIIAGGLLGWNRKGPNGELLFIMYGGLFYRLNDAFIPTIRIRYKDYAFTLSYDVNTSKLKAASNLRGAYELSVIKVGLINSPEREKSRTICPEFY